MTQRIRVFAGTLVYATLAVSGVDRAVAAESIAWIEDLGLRAEVPLVALPAAAGAIIGIDEQRKTDAYIQTITLQGDRETLGENQIVVTVTRNGLAPRIEQDNLETEMADRLPDLHMALGPSGTRNGIGIFGAAVGSKGPLNCIYAWQSVNLADHLITGKDASVFDERHALSIRYRLCRTTLSVAGLTTVVAGAQAGPQEGGAIMNVALGRDALSAAAGLSPMTARMTGEALSPPNMGVGIAQGDVQDLPRPRARPPRRIHHVQVRAAPSMAQSAEPAQRVPMAGMPSVPLPQ